MPRLYAATGDSGGSARRVERRLDDRVLARGKRCAVHRPRSARPGHAVRGASRRRCHAHERTAARTWSDCGLPAEDVFSLAVSAANRAVYAGTEPSALYRSDDGGDTWRELAALLDLPSRPTWSFPPRPWTSHVRWIAPSPHDADVLLAGIELGGLMRSTNGGESWQDQRPGSQPDVHSLAWHPNAAGRAYEAGGGGAAWSEDGGDTWRPADDGRDRHYTWSVAVDPVDPDLWYVSASTGPFAAHGRGDPRAHVYRRENGGWRALAGGLPIRSPPCRTCSSRPRIVSSQDLRTASSGRARTAARPGVRACSAARRSTASSRSASARPPSCRCSARCARPRRPRGVIRAERMQEVADVVPTVSRLRWSRRDLLRRARSRRQNLGLSRRESRVRFRHR